jgi:hypothetical protein
MNMPTYSTGDGGVIEFPGRLGNWEPNMTEAEWLASTQPEPMLAFLGSKAIDGTRSAGPVIYVDHPRKYPEYCYRKLALFSCACCDHFWHLLKSKSSQRVVEVSERWVEGLASWEELWRARNNAKRRPKDAGFREVVRRDHTAYHDPSHDLSLYASFAAIEVAYSDDIAESAFAASSVAVSAAADQDNERATHCTWLRDLFGPLPFRPVTIAPAVLTWNEDCVVKIAQAIYDERRFTDLPILADALEEAGCDDADILNHCREPDLHVRGCWVMDLLLGKECVGQQATSAGRLSIRRLSV